MSLFSMNNSPALVPDKVISSQLLESKIHKHGFSICYFVYSEPFWDNCHSIQEHIEIKVDFRN